MGVKSRGLYVDLDQVLEEGRLDAAWMGAWERGHITLPQALRLTVLMGIDKEPRYEAACRRFLIRFMHEYSPSLKLLQEVIKALESLTEFAVYPSGDGPEYELKQLAHRIERVQSGDLRHLQRKNAPLEIAEP